MSDQMSILPTPRRPRVDRRVVIAGCIAVAAVVGIVVAIAASGDDGDPAADVTTTIVTTSTSAGTDPDAESTTSADGESTGSSRPGSTATTGATSSSAALATTTVADVEPVTTLPPPASTSPPTPSTTGPDNRSPRQAYTEEYTKYCQATFRTSPTGQLVDPDVPDDPYTVDDCLYWLDPDWGEFFDTAPEAAQEGINDAISTIEDMSFTSVLCWIDQANDQYGGCWYSPNL
jgi:hypothetical protein